MCTSFSRSCYAARHPHCPTVLHRVAQCQVHGIGNTADCLHASPRLVTPNTAPHDHSPPCSALFHTTPLHSHSPSPGTHLPSLRNTSSWKSRIDADRLAATVQLQIYTQCRVCVESDLRLNQPHCFCVWWSLVWLPGCPRHPHIYFSAAHTVISTQARSSEGACVIQWQIARSLHGL